MEIDIHIDELTDCLIERKTGLRGLEAGCDGVVAFTAKSDLVDYYRNVIHAVEVMPRRMVIFEDVAQKLINKYILDIE